MAHDWKDATEKERRMKTASHLFVDPAGEVVRELLQGVIRLRLALKKAKAKNEELKKQRDFQYAQLIEAVNAGIACGLPATRPLPGEIKRLFKERNEVLAGNTRLRASLAAAEELNIILRDALEESVALQSHYAAQINTYDAGERMEFASADDWLKRLATLPKQNSKEVSNCDNLVQPNTEEE